MGDQYYLRGDITYKEVPFWDECLVWNGRFVRQNGC